MAYSECFEVQKKYIFIKYIRLIETLIKTRIKNDIYFCLQRAQNVGRNCFKVVRAEECLLFMWGKICSLGKNISLSWGVYSQGRTLNNEGVKMASTASRYRVLCRYGRSSSWFDDSNDQAWQSPRVLACLYLLPWIGKRELHPTLGCFRHCRIDHHYEKHKLFIQRLSLLMEWSIGRHPTLRPPRIVRLETLFLSPKRREKHRLNAQCIFNHFYRYTVYNCSFSSELSNKERRIYWKKICYHYRRFEHFL